MKKILVLSIVAMSLFLGGCFKSMVDSMAPPVTRVEGTDVQENNVSLFWDSRGTKYVVDPPLDGVVVAYEEGVPEYVTDKFRAELLRRGVTPKNEVSGSVLRYTVSLSDFQWNWTARVELTIECNGNSQKVVGGSEKTNWGGTKSAVATLDLALTDAFSKIDYSTIN